jgi:pimeloyl-ACP methyl ester carboxylesterase
LSKSSMARSNTRHDGAHTVSTGAGRSLISACATCVLVAWPSLAASPINPSQTVIFTEYTSLSTNLEMARRLLTPLTAARIPGRLAAMNRALADQPIALEQERFRLYAPRTAPAAGYGVLVFIPPWDDDHIPLGWADVLEARGVIFVSGEKTGNTASPLGRREPLALLAAYNVMRRYRVDRRRVYVAGFSGGSRVAMRLAVGYPDLFSGALLDAGADPLGEADFPLPPRDLFDRLRTASRLDYFAGAQDPFHLRQQDASVASLRRWCVVNIMARSKMGLAHEIAPASVLATALSDLDEPLRTPAAKDADCWARVTGAVADALARARAAVARSDVKRAKILLIDIDKRFGGLASPDIAELASRLPEPGPSSER